MKKSLLALSLMSVCSFALADNFVMNALTNVSNGVKSEWQNSMNGSTELYVPFETWHNRATYDHEKIASYNERPWGLGFGKGYIHDNGNWSGFYAMAFKDSHNKWEPIAGYGYTKNFYPLNNPWFLGIGYTVFITARQDIMNYVPFPAALPLVSTGYKNFTIQGTYIPGGKNNGNVAFLWGKYSF